MYSSSSQTPRAAALIFAVLAYLILLILSGAAGGFAEESGNDNGLPSPPGAVAQSGMSARVIAAALIPVSLLLILAYIPELGDPLDPSATVQLGSTFAVFWLLMSLALVGAVLGFIYPRTGALEAVLVGGTVVVAHGAFRGGAGPVVIIKHPSPLPNVALQKRHCDVRAQKARRILP